MKEHAHFQIPLEPNVLPKLSKHLKTMHYHKHSLPRETQPPTKDRQQQGLPTVPPRKNKQRDDICCLLRPMETCQKWIVKGSGAFICRTNQAPVDIVKMRDFQSDIFVSLLDSRFPDFHDTINVNSTDPDQDHPRGVPCALVNNAEAALVQELAQLNLTEFQRRRTSITWHGAATHNYIAAKAQGS